MLFRVRCFNFYKVEDKLHNLVYPLVRDRMQMIGWITMTYSPSSSRRRTVLNPLM